MALTEAQSFLRGLVMASGGPVGRDSSCKGASFSLVLLEWW